MLKTKLNTVVTVAVLFVSMGAIHAAHAGPNKDGPAKEGRASKESLSVREHEMPSREREFKREFERLKEYDKPVRRDFLGDALISGGVGLAKP